MKKKPYPKIAVSLCCGKLAYLVDMPKAYMGRDMHECSACGKSCDIKWVLETAQHGKEE